jgi:hypothetical protein
MNWVSWFRKFHDVAGRSEEHAGGRAAEEHGTKEQSEKVGCGPSAIQLLVYQEDINIE